MRPTRDIGPRSILSHGLGTTYTGQVDSLSWKDAVRVATTANITIASDLNVGDTIDGITLVDGDRVLVKDQTDASENGIYVAGASPERSTDLNQSNEILGDIVTVIEGTVNSGTTWRVTNDADTTIDVDDINWDTFGGGGSITVSETDGSPSVDPVTEIKFPPDTVTDLGSGVVSIRDVPQAFIGAKAYNSSTQTMNGSGTNSGNTIVTFDSEEFDSDGFHSTSSNTGRLTVPAGLGGKYLVGWYCWSSAGATGAGAATLVPGVTGSATPRGLRPPVNPVSAQGGTVWTSETVMDLVAGDYVELTMNNTNAATFTIGHASVDSVRSAIWIVKLDSGKVGAGIGARAYHNTTQNFSNGTTTTVALNAEDFDTDGFHDNSTNNERLTVPAGLGGKYLVQGCVSYPFDADGDRFVYLFKNGTSTNLAVASTRATVSTGDQTRVMISTVVDLVPGDYVIMRGYQDAGGTLAVEGGNNLTWLLIMRLDSGSLTKEIAPGYEMAYAQVTSNTSPTATTEATANTVVTAPAVSLDGATSIYVEFYSSQCRPDTAGAGRSLSVVLYDGSSIGIIGVVITPAATSSTTSPMLVRRKLTPSAGSHTYSIRAFVSAGTGLVAGGAGGSGANMPAYIRIIRA